MAGLPALVSPSAHEAQPTRRLDAGFAAQMLGQGGGRRGLQAGLALLCCAHDSYRAAASAQPVSIAARLSI